MNLKSLIIASCLTLGLSATTWAQNTDLVDQLQPKMLDLDTATVVSTLNTQQPKYQLTQAKSCDQLKSVFVEWAKNIPQYNYPMYATDSVAVSAQAPMAKAEGIGGWMDMWTSQTNTQVAGIDEPDLVKQDTRAMYFSNTEKQQVEIYAHRTITGKGKITSTIKIPDGMYNAQLMLRGNQLIILWAYYDQTRSNQTSIIDSSTVTVVALYDITTLKTPKLIKHYKAPWYYQDVRLNGNQLTVVSNLWLNLYGLRDGSIAVDSAKMMPYWWYNAAPTTLKNDDSLRNVALDCTSVRYPTGTGMTDMSMTSVITIDLTNPGMAKSTLIAGNTQTVYMSKDRLYLIGNQWLNDTSSICPANARCIWNPGTSYTQVTSLDPLNPSKPVVSRVIGYPLGQYAYHQDAAGKFYLVSQANRISDNQTVSHVWSLDKAGMVAGALLNLAPGEQFKSSRYIGDKLYLITFEQVDPLFVIDLSKTSPTILGELKIPWYSTYLHPYGTINGKTYLLWLGYDVDNSNGRTVNSGVKLDLYEVDYAKVVKWNISIKQIQSQRIGWPGTESEALYNPRMFVYDDISKTVYVPLVRNNQKIVKFCPTGVSYKPEQCYDNYTTELLFAWYKGITVTPTSIKQTKIVDYTTQYQIIAKTKGYSNDGYYINWLNNRVWYNAGQIWFVNNWFMRTEKK
jgi:inhibitor of cysteine peptidase